MPERRTKIHYPTPASPERDGSEVLVGESSEKWSEFTLEDGTVLRVKTSVIAAVRIDNEFDPEGNPAYAIKMQPQVAIVSAPDKLKRRVQ